MVLFTAVVLATLFAICVIITGSQYTSQKYPNFVFILADDMGWGDPSYNNGTAYTPHLDAWTQQANTITFWRGYAGGPSCSPTRASILSGRTPNRECIYSANGCGSKPAWECSEPMPFPNTTFTIADAVKAGYNNYETAFFGKWHLGNFWRKNNQDGTTNPSNVGFDYWFATEASAPSVTTNCGCFTPYQGCVTGHYAQEGQGPWCTGYWYRNMSSNIGVTNSSYKIPGEDTIYLVDQFENWLNQHIGKGIQNKNAVDKDVDMSDDKSYIDSDNSDYEPFLVLLFLHPVHVEFLATDEYREACINGTVCPIKENGNYSSAQLDYFGDLASMDVQIKRIRDLLSEYNVLNNTMIWFTSDNGPEGDSTGPFGDINWPGSTNGLRGRKRDVWEGGIREPTIIQWNGMINNTNGFNSTFPIVTYDLLPTIMELLNVTSTHPDWDIDGMSLVSMLKDPENVQIRDKPMGWIHNNGTAYANQSWKIVIDSKDCQQDSGDCNPALYNIENDPFETTNLTDKYLNVYNDMMNQLNQWLISVNDSQYYDSRCALRNSNSTSNLSLSESKSKFTNYESGFGNYVGTWHQLFEKSKHDMKHLLQKAGLK